MAGRVGPSSVGYVLQAWLCVCQLLALCTSAVTQGTRWAGKQPLCVNIMQQPTGAHHSNMRHPHLQHVGHSMPHVGHAASHLDGPEQVLAIGVAEDRRRRKEKQGGGVERRG